VTAILRRQGLRLVIFLDDILLLNSSEEGARKDLKTALDLLQNLGFLINWEKSVVSPTQIMEYLGMVVDSIRTTFALPSMKVKEIKKFCERAIENRQISLRNMASILGNFTWAIPTIPFAASHYRSMQGFYLKQSKKVKGDLSKKFTISSEAETDLKWWVDNLEQMNGKAFFPEKPNIEICSDASLSGWGAICHGVTTSGPWTADQACLHIN